MSMFKELLQTKRHMKGEIAKLDNLIAWMDRIGPSHAELRNILTDLRADVRNALDRVQEARKVEKQLRKPPG